MAGTAAIAGGVSKTFGGSDNNMLVAMGFGAISGIPKVRDLPAIPSFATGAGLGVGEGGIDKWLESQYGKNSLYSYSYSYSHFFCPHTYLSFNGC